jgi:predicted dienelactone hydrolase
VPIQAVGPRVYPIAVALALSMAAPAASIAATAYDPLAIPTNVGTRVVDLVFRDAQPTREIPLLVYLPPGQSPAPVVLFSHGLGGSREGNAFMGQHWAARGYVAVFMQHAGSDTSVWRDKAVAQRMAAMKQAASAQNLVTRVKDVHAVIDQLERWNSDGASVLKGRLDLKRIGMSGHSFGALTTQAVSGEKFPVGGRMIDSRIKAAIMFSPSPPRRGDAKEAFGAVAIPWMLMTGTEDVAPIGEADVASRLAVFPALAPGRKYELVLDKAEHSAFTERALPGDHEKRNPNHHRAILALSTAFWDAYLNADAAAREWLNGKGPASVLEPKDRWRTK